MSGACSSSGTAVNGGDDGGQDVVAPPPPPVDGNGGTDATDATGASDGADGSSPVDAAPIACAVDHDCPVGEICGLSVDNVCGQCQTDLQCQTDPTYGPGDVCDTATGLCVSGACSTPSAACPVNGADFCCAPSSDAGVGDGGAGDSCVTGNCCVNSDCSSGQTCVNHICSSCPGPVGNTLVVDPVNGSDTANTGNPSCPFRTITRALAALGGALSTPSIVKVEGTATVGAGEVFPIILAQNVTVQGDSASIPTIEVPANVFGFVLQAPATGLSTLVLDGSGNTGTLGVVAQTGSDATTAIDHVTVQNFHDSGMVVRNHPATSTVGGVLAIGLGCLSTKNGTAGGADSTRNGLVLLGNAVATISGGTGPDTTSFSANSGHGIKIEGTGAITLAGTPGSAGAGTVLVNGNGATGIAIEQTPATGNPTSAITGVVAFQNTGHGIEIFGGSAAKLRRSVLLGNSESGLQLSTSQVGASDDLSQIDLGTDATVDPGGNTFQAATGFNPNARAGLCLAITSTAAQVVRASGNIFSGPTNGLRDCSQATPGQLTIATTTCAGSIDLGFDVSQGTNAVTTLNCTQ